VVIAHGVPPTAGDAAFVRCAFAWLSRRDRVAQQPSDNQHFTIPVFLDLPRQDLGQAQ